jgi:DNA-binding response OmpR family regulator
MVTNSAARVSPLRAAQMPVLQLVLLVDPDEDTRELYKTFLLPRRYVVEEAADGPEALAKAISDPPDIVVTETRLARIDGYSLCELLRKDCDTKGASIVVLTGEGRTFNHDRLRGIGADAILVKPCMPEMLLAEMERVRKHSADLRERATPVGGASDARLARSQQLLERCAPATESLTKAHQRYETTTPPREVPELACPGCLRMLKYERSFVGGVTLRFTEQWDELTCASGCGEFEYRHRTRKLRRRSS